MTPIASVFGILVTLSIYASAYRNFENNLVAWWFIQTLPSNTGSPAWYYIDDTMIHAKYYEGFWYNCENATPLENTLKAVTPTLPHTQY
jgi:hypothetical protein